jgi:hypothetical protein
LKPFIKPRTAPPPAPEPPPKVSPNELAILAVAGAIADPVERAAYLEHVCGADGGLRARLEKKLAEKNGHAAAQTAMVTHAEVFPALPNRGQGAVAIVPMPDMQLTQAGHGPAKQSPFPWLLATLLAAAVGALAVFFVNEKAARALAENRAHEALGEKTSAEKERELALAGALEAKTIASRTEEKRVEAERQRTDADTRRATAEAESQKAKAEAEKLRTETEAAKRALETARQQTAGATEAQKLARLELAATLAKYAGALLDQNHHAEAVAPAWQALELRMTFDPAGWATQDVRFTLGAALMGKGDMDGAEKQLLAALSGMEPLLGQVGEPERTRRAAAIKKLAQLYTTTGKKKEAAEWRKKLEAPR